MNKSAVALIMSLAAIPFSGCSDDSVPRAKFGNAGSIDGGYDIREMLITDTSGGFSDFAYGYTSSYPGASASISGLGIPNHVSGHWSKQPENELRPAGYYKLDSVIDSKIAEQKIETLKNAYVSFEKDYATVQIVVNKSNLQVLYTFKCFTVREDCSKKAGSDPNGWIVKSPNGSTDVVVLFSGEGEASTKPFPTSPYDNRRIRAANVGETVISEATFGDINAAKHTVGDRIVLPRSFSVSWRKKLNPEADYSQWQFESYQLAGELGNLDWMEEAIQAYRNATNGYLKTSTFDVFAEGDSLFITYSAACLTDTVGERCEVAKDPNSRWRYFDEIGRHALILFHGKGQKVPQ
ncbi:hypothetical protein [Enterovibrio norvegicus]|uniref:Uncharacterized protein n=1 Tax=Enterovibrio norvegicus TaxID=188144 RepID=A0A2N7LHT8_9GAMM|nr:hypothetical protein [Enterovibrio norvegicus]PMN95100.1 hypothetical protein BCT23_00165 [Enterovibrio norvegicus]